MGRPAQPSGGPQRGALPVQLGALVPISPPGWVEAGRQLLAGLELALGEVNRAGGVAGRPLELVVRDTAADPGRATAAVDDLVRLGVAAIAGEYHSVAARAAAARAEALGVPFLCSSAVLDALADQPARWVARLAPPQSQSWRVYANFLLDAGHRRVAAVLDPGRYWASGAQILREQLTRPGGTFLELDARGFSAAAVSDELVDQNMTAVLLLVGHPEPAASIARVTRRDPRLGGLTVGAPAGQPELGDWDAMLGGDGAAVPFLRYLPHQLTPLGTRVEHALRRRLAPHTPSFVAFEGYDTVLVLASLLRSFGPDSGPAAEDFWPQLIVDGTRGRIDFSRPAGANVWQWVRSPIQVADRDPADPARFRVRYR